MDKHVETTWIVVARRDDATIYSTHASGDELKVVLEIEDPRVRVSSLDIDSDRAGSSLDRACHDAHASSEELGSPGHVQREFAAQLALQLDVSRCRGDFDRLILVAAPKLLGQLRAELTGHTRKLIVAELSMDLVERDEAALRRHLEDALDL